MVIILTKRVSSTVNIKSSKSSLPIFRSKPEQTLQKTKSSLAQELPQERTRHNNRGVALETTLTTGSYSIRFYGSIVLALS